jgi:hypothetical protein
MWGKFWAGRVAGEASPLALEWWPIFSNLPTVFHSFLYAAAVHYDDLHLTTSLSKTREILMHKNEAVHQLRKVLADLNGEMPRDAHILAMTYLGIASDENGRSRIEDEKTPFIPPEPVNSVQWKRHFAYPKDNVHIAAAKKLIDMKGGLDGRCLILAKSNFLYMNLPLSLIESPRLIEFQKRPTDLSSKLAKATFSIMGHSDDYV